jgi:hypothetical protein
MKTNEEIARSLAEQAVDIAVSAYQRPAFTKADAVADITAIILQCLTQAQEGRS